MAGRLLGAALLLALTGCSNTSRLRACEPVSTALVLRSGGQCTAEAARAAMQRVDEGAWEYGRNDRHLNVGGDPLGYGVQVAQIRTTDRLQTSNGRPFEFSTTYIRAVTERSSR